MKTLIKYLCCLWLCYGVGSCAPLPNPEEATKTNCKIVQITQLFNNIQIKTVFNYDQNNKIVSYTVNNTNYAITYDANQNIEKIVDSRGWYSYSFGYKNPLFPKAATAASLIDKINRREKYLLITYENNRPKSFTSVTTPTQDYVFTYNAKGNVTSYLYTLNNSPSKKTVFNTFDNAKNPYQLLPFPIYWSLSNSLIEIDILTYFSKNNLLENEGDEINVYGSYNKAGFPLNTTFLQDVSVTFTYDGCD